MKLIIGLGNPGKKYEQTWHNLGFLALEEIRQGWNFPSFKNDKKLKAEISEGRSGKEKIILAKPQTFMNNSGEAAAALVNYYKAKIEDLMIIHDDVDLPLGKIRIALDSSSGGHNGVKSVIGYLGTKKFIRIKIGCRGELTEKIGTLNYVLEPIGKSQKTAIAAALCQATLATAGIINESLPAAMNKFN